MDLNLSRIREIRDELQNLFSLIKSPRVYTDYDRYNFLSTELDTLVNILNMLEQRAYKESFVLLRTTFEKFLYFWLMFEGKRFRWTDTYNIRPKISKTPKEARDRTIALRTEKKNGNPKLKDVLQIQPGSLDHEINVTFELCAFSSILLFKCKVFHLKIVYPLENKDDFHTMLTLNLKLCYLNRKS
jgi:hypothetical protein